MIQSGDGDQTVLRGNEGERAEKDSFNPAEDGGGGSDAEREAEDREDREAGTAAEHPDAEKKVLQHIGGFDG